VQNLQILNYILLFSSQPTNRVQTQCSASVSPTGTVRIPVSESCTAVCSGFKADCQYKLNTQNSDGTDSGYQEALEIHCKFSRLTDGKLSIQCPCFESSVYWAGPAFIRTAGISCKRARIGTWAFVFVIKLVINFVVRRILMY